MEVTSYAPGTPNWVDVSSGDLPVTVAFYQALFGWDAADQGEEAGHYTMFEIDGKPVAAAGPKMSDDGPPSWTTYISVTDVDATAAAITANGGTVIVPPMDVMDVGRMACAFDPGGTFFSVWQPKLHIGAVVVNEPNTWCWNELTCRGADELLEFYCAVFGWTIHKNEGQGFVYREIMVDGRSVAGCMEMEGDQWPAELPNHWMSYFAVADCDATAARAAELGGTVHVPPFDIPMGRISVLTDPTGAVFSIIRFAGSAD